MKYTAAVLALWAVALFAVLRILPNGQSSKIAGLFAICMIGSVIVVRLAQKRSQA